MKILKYLASKRKTIRRYFGLIIGIISIFSLVAIFTGGVHVYAGEVPAVPEGWELVANPANHVQAHVPAHRNKHYRPARMRAGQLQGRSAHIPACKDGKNLQHQGRAGGCRTDKEVQGKEDARKLRGRAHALS